ncbi:aldo/keto reductase [Schaalia sp. lx-260]|uniref:aldo/keto reductase n=1 Tax=Schaalia sp. lx-260 TaxID=2899082 RepID=UPI001E2F28C7|nr:aldo/keto reductase [Schaalia sp. lx-260]MCD4548859.1 aldo/keto reductase [Schaalia sp. lx-260]
MLACPIPHVLLPTGAAMPQLGFGTYKVDPEVTFDVVSQAIELGYRHIDTAQMYANEAQVGQAWEQSGLSRDQVFLTSKLNNGNHQPERARDSFARTLDDLRTDYVDLFLIHWPLPSLYGGDLMMPWRVLEEFFDQGRARAIGVSNFQPDHLKVLFNHAEIQPMVSQVEAHPYLPNNAVRDMARHAGMVTQAWSPLARGRAAHDPLLASIGEKYGASASQVALRWATMRGDVVFPKSLSVQRQRENFMIFDYELSEQDMESISALDEGEAGRTGSHPDTMNRL